MVSPQTRDVIRREQEIYERDLRAKLESTNLHDFVAVEPESGDYYLGRSMSEAVQKARAAHPDCLSYLARVGHRAAIHLGAALT